MELQQRMDRVLRALRSQAQGGDVKAMARAVALMLATMPPDDSREAARRAAEARAELPRRWRLPGPSEVNDFTEGIRYHAGQAAARQSQARHRCIEAGRRSGKSEDRKREAVIRALDPDWPGWAMGLTDKFVVVGAPTQAQTERIYLQDLRRMIPARFLSELRLSPVPSFHLTNGAVIILAGMDKPQRSEGFPIDELFFDEYAEMKPEAWTDHLSYSLDTPGRPPGRVTFFSTPDMKSGRHFIDLCDEAVERQRAGDDWSYHHWSSKGIVDEETWNRRRRSSDPATFAVEMEARRVSTGNRAYFPFEKNRHVTDLRLVPSRPVWMCLDFNVAPGVAVLAQEQTRHDYPGRTDWPAGTGSEFTACLGEVWIPKQSNTPAVVRAVLHLLQGFQGVIEIYGDATGGARGTAKVEGSDWEIVRRMLRKEVGLDGYEFRVPNRNPPERARVNAVNARLLNDEGTVSMLIDPRCRHLIDDFERVSLLQGGTGELHKPSKGTGSELTHISDGLGYAVHEHYGETDSFVEFGWSQ